MALARTRPGRLLYQRLLLPLDVRRLRGAGMTSSGCCCSTATCLSSAGGRSLRYAVLVHDVLPLTNADLWPAGRRALKKGAFRSLRTARPTVFTSTEYNAAQIRRLLGVEATVVRFGCGQLADAAADAALSGPLPPRQPYVIAVGTLEPRKNLLALVDSFEGVTRLLPELELRLVGRGAERYEALLTERIAMSPVREQIHIHRDIDRQEALEMISRATALVFPSLAEGFGLPVIEALALGTPVVASDLPEIRSWAGDAAAYAPATDSEAWVEAIVGAGDVSDKRRREGQDWVRMHRWRDCAAALLDW